MSDVKNLYILKQPITARKDSEIERGAFCQPGYDDIMVTSLPASWDAEQCADYQLPLDVFNDTFKPLDIETIRQKLDLFASEYYDDAVNNEKDYANQNRMEREFFEVKEIQHKSFVDAVLGVVGLTKETE